MVFSLGKMLYYKIWFAYTSDEKENKKDYGLVGNRHSV